MRTGSNNKETGRNNKEARRTAEGVARVFMEKKVKKEIDAVTDELRETIARERTRGSSLSEMQQESEGLDKDITVFAGASAAAKRRLWWKSAKWIIALCLLLGAIVFFIFVYFFKGSK